MTHKAIAYILGFVLGDGNISRSGFLVRLYEQNLQFVQTVLKPRFSECFGVEPGISFDKSNNSYVLHKRSEVVWRQLHDSGVPPGRKARIIVVPEHISLADSTIKSAFVSGVFDAEASQTLFVEADRHPRGYPYFEVKMYSPTFIEGLGKLLVGISDEFKPRIYHYDYGSILRLNGRKQLSLVSSHLHLMHPRFNRPLADLETRAGELTVMARLRVQSPEPKRKRCPVTRKGVGRGLKGP